MARRVLLPSTDSTDRTLEYIDTVLEKGGYDTWGASGVQAELLEQSSGRKPSPGASRGFRPLTQGGAGGQAEAQLGRSPARACLRPCASASASLPGLPARSPGSRGASGPVTLSRDWPGSRGASETPVSQAAPGSVRLAQLRSSQRARAEKEQELDQAFSAPPQWWQSVQTQQRSAQLALWAQQAFSKEALENLALSLPPLADEAARHGSELPGQCHAELQHAQSAPLRLGSAPARLLRLLRACLAALGSSALPGRCRPTEGPATAPGARASRLQSRRCYRH